MADVRRIVRRDPADVSTHRGAWVEVNDPPLRSVEKPQSHPLGRPLRGRTGDQDGLPARSSPACDARTRVIAGVGGGLDLRHALEGSGCAKARLPVLRRRTGGCAVPAGPSLPEECEKRPEVVSAYREEGSTMAAPGREFCNTLGREIPDLRPEVPELIRNVIRLPPSSCRPESPYGGEAVEMLPSVSVAKGWTPSPRPIR